MTDRKYSCQGCDRTDLTLTANGKVRSHAANGKRASKDNPACEMGSAYPKESTKFHTHTSVVPDGDGGFMCECGMWVVEQDLSDDPSLHVPTPPNPFRAPLPGGVWDGVPCAGEPVYAGPGTVVDHVATPAPRPGPVDADDFLDGAEDEPDSEQAEDGRRYFPSRYDGTCVTCLSSFDARDMITRSLDGEKWEAQDCCGENAVQSPDRPRAVARTLPVVNGRYKFPHPVTGKPTSGQRASKYAEGIQDKFALDEWKQRNVVLGMALRPDLVEKAQSAVRDRDPIEVIKKERLFLNRLSSQAKDAAGSNRRSEKGTKLHKYTEELDGGTRQLSDVPEEFRKDSDAYLTALAEAGFRPVKDLIERSVFVDELGVVGTFDRVLECVRDTQTVDLDGRPVQIHAGEFVIGDVKSGSNIEAPWLEILIQLAIYAHAVNENGVAVQAEPGDPFRWEPLKDMGVGKVREDVGVVMHVPYGSGECKLYFADLITGWRGALICKSTRDFWKIKLPKQPVMSVVLAEDDMVDRLAMENRAMDDEAPYLADLEATSNEDGGQDCSCGKRTYNADGMCDDCIEDARVECECGKTWPTYDDMTAAGHNDMDCPDNIMGAVHQKIHETSPEKEAERIEQAFRNARTREEANAAWAEAKRLGVKDETIKWLVGLVKLEDQGQEAVSRPGSSTRDEPVAETGGSRQTEPQPQDGPTLTQRANAVTTKAEASKIFHEAKAKIATMETEEQKDKARSYLDKLTKIMQDRLASV